MTSAGPLGGEDKAASGQRPQARPPGRVHWLFGVVHRGPGTRGLVLGPEAGRLGHRPASPVWCLRACGLWAGAEWAQASGMHEPRDLS